MLAYLRVPIGWMELFKRSVKEALADDVLDLAAQQAYYFFFALFPALLFVIAVASFFPLQTLINDVVTMLSSFAPQAVIQVITDAMASLSKQNSGGILTFGFLITVWSSSGAMVSIITTLNTAYDVTESRPWWKTRIIAIGVTMALAVFIIASMFLVIAGPTLAENIAARMHLGPAFKWAWWVLQWLGVSLALKLYYQLVPSANAAYGAIGGIMVLMLWFYCSGLALLLGAEVNAEIEHASPYGKDPGERVPGEKRIVGARAQRLYEEKRAKGEMPVPPIPDGENCDIDRAPVVMEPKTRPSDLILGTIALAPAALLAAKKMREEMKKSA